MARPVEYMRADAARNVQRILEVAAGLLSENPNVGMADVGAAAGVSRATVYRHFPTREALVKAIHVEAVEQTERALEACDLDSGSASDALRRLCAAWLEVSERFSMPRLISQPGMAVPDEVRDRGRRVLGEPLAALFARGQAAGEFSPALPVTWCIRVFGALLLAGARAIDDGTLTREAAPEAVFRSLHEGLRA